MFAILDGDLLIGAGQGKEDPSQRSHFPIGSDPCKTTSAVAAHHGAWFAEVVLSASPGNIRTQLQALCSSTPGGLQWCCSSRDQFSRGPLQRNLFSRRRQQKGLLRAVHWYCWSCRPSPQEWFSAVALAVHFCLHPGPHRPWATLATPDQHSTDSALETSFEAPCQVSSKTVKYTFLSTEVWSATCLA